ncbi:type II toxin-antitoxin system HicA family toxin [bacterium]|nr:type II toxin-antitoxin system HicA family toxin [bacterium]
MPRITPLPARKLRRIFELAGFALARTEGGHFVYTKPGVKRPVVIPNYDEVPVFVIKCNLRSAGISREEYFELLRRV